MKGFSKNIVVPTPYFLEKIKSRFWRDFLNLIDQKMLANRGLRTTGCLLYLLALVSALYCSKLSKDEDTDEFCFGNFVLVVLAVPVLLLGIWVSLTCLSFLKV